jgi:hypothetical protein
MFYGIIIRMYFLDNQHHGAPHVHARYAEFEASISLNDGEAVMYWDVKTVRPLDDYEIYVELEDGRKGVFDLKPYLNHGVFRELQDKKYFDQVGIVFGAVTWPHEQDIAPETLVAGLKSAEERAVRAD